MLEIYCRASIRKKCLSITGRKPIISLKSQQNQKWEYEGFYDGTSDYDFIWSFETFRARNDTFRKCAGLFSNCGAKLAETWVRERYRGDWNTAIKSHRNFNEFFDAFEGYFAERRQIFMDKTAELIRQLNPELKNIRPIKTNSHGGVANLLKVLTKTMHEQGSTIRTIARVQYAVCLQAGIYVPEEFLNDVLTAEDIDNTIYEGEKTND